MFAVSRQLLPNAQPPVPHAPIPHPPPQRRIRLRSAAAVRGEGRKLPFHLGTGIQDIRGCCRRRTSADLLVVAFRSLRTCIRRSACLLYSIVPSRRSRIRLPRQMTVRSEQTRHPYRSPEQIAHGHQPPRSMPSADRAAHRLRQQARRQDAARAAQPRSIPPGQRRRLSPNASRW